MDMPSAGADVLRWYEFGRAVAAGTAAEPDQQRLHAALAGDERALDAYLAGRKEEQLPDVPAPT
jgi:phage gp36-like protein